MSVLILLAMMIARCMMASPLWITYDIFKPPPGIHEIVTNAEAIAIDQDALGQVSK